MADAESLAGLVLEAFYARHGRAAPEQTPATEIAQWRDRLGVAGQLCLVAKSNQGPLAVIRFVPSWYRDPADQGSRYAHMSVLALEPSLWGSGLAGQLLAAGHGRVREQGLSAVELWTVADNLRAQRFYEKAGYVPTGATEESKHGAPLVQLKRGLGPMSRGPR
jgi:ribosomal protein S18 acetylase RimI-like enzyme